MNILFGQRKALLTTLTSAALLISGTALAKGKPDDTPFAPGKPGEGTIVDIAVAVTADPDVDGFGLAERIKQDEHLGGTVVMMLTSGDRPGDALQRRRRSGIAPRRRSASQAAAAEILVRKTPPETLRTKTSGIVKQPQGAPKSA